MSKNKKKKSKFMFLTDRARTRRRIFYLTQAMNKAKNPEFKELWKRKIEELSKNL